MTAAVRGASGSARPGLRDLLSSFVVFLVALPLCMGIAIASGVPPAAGLITGIVGGLLVGSISGSPLQVSGPAAGLAVLVFELVREHGMAMLGPVVLVAGLIQLAAGAFRAGLWFRMVSPAVVNGMLAGIGLLIIVSQLHVLFDAAPLARGLENIAAIPQRLYAAFFDGDGLTAGLLGAGTIALMLAWDKLRPSSFKLLPAALIAAVGATLAAQLLQLPVKLVELPDNLWSAVSLPGAEVLDGIARRPFALLAAAIVFAVIASAETLLSGAAVDRMHDGPRTNYDRELRAQGIGNLICGALGALPMTGVIVRSAANVQAGARTRWSAVMHGAWLLAFVALLPGVLRLTPVSGLAAILIYTGFKMIKPQQLRELAEYGRGSVAVYVLTAVAIVATDLLVGVCVGLALSLARLAFRAARLHLSLKAGPEPGQASLRMVGFATFLNVPWIARTLEQVEPGTQLQLDIERLKHIDHACLALLQDWQNTATAQGGGLKVDWSQLEARAEGGSPRRELVQITA